MLVISLPGQAPNGQPPGAARFHHIHLNSRTPVWQADFYQRLFHPSTTRRVELWEAHGIESAGVYLLVSRGRAETHDESPSAIWHFGWGPTSLDESYRSHLLSEVEWDTPIASLTSRFHVHLRSAEPVAAADWYRAHLSGEKTVSRQREPIALGPPADWPIALVKFGEISLIIYRSPEGSGPRVSSRGQFVDHLAFSVPGLDQTLARLREARVRILEDVRPLGETAATMIEGPDAIALELIQGR